MKESTRGVRGGELDPSLELTERRLLVETVASLLVHDLRNTFAGVQAVTSFIELQIKKTELWGKDPRVAESFRLLERSLAEAAESAEAWRGAARVRSPLRVAMPECVERAVHALRSPHPVELDLQAGSVTGDPLELTVAVRCLVENAVEASCPGAPVRITAASTGTSYRIQIRDNGAGMSEAELEQALQAFFSTKQEHPGFGLVLVHRVATRHGGGLTLVSSPSGTTAQLELPLPPQ